MVLIVSIHAIPNYQQPHLQLQPREVLTGKCGEKKDGWMLYISCTCASDMPYRYQLEFDRLLAEKKQYEASYQQLAIEYDSLRDQFVSVHVYWMAYLLFISCCRMSFYKRKRILKPI